MKKSLWILGAALCMLGFAACSDDDEGTQAAVGITAGTVIPEGSAVAYDFVVNGTYLENTNDSSVEEIVGASRMSSQEVNAPLARNNDA